MKNVIIVSSIVAAGLFAGCCTDCGSAAAKTDSCCADGACEAAVPNTLSAAEKAAGWQLLWDGKTLDGWVGEKGVLTVLPRKGINDGKWVDIPKEQAALGGGGDLVTAKDYRDFELSVDFRLTKAANSGIKYFYNKDKFKGTCEEYQILDEAHPDSTKGRDGKCRRVASLYDMMPANAEPYVKPLGQWNTAKIVSKGTHVEHWLNGTKVLEYERGSAEFRAIVAQSKYAKEEKPGEHWGEAPTGRIKLQDHSDSTVSFRNLKIREL